MTGDPAPPDRTKPRPNGGVYAYETTQGRRFGFLIETDPKPDGRRSQRRRQGFPTKTAARQARDAERTKRREGAWVEPSRETVAAYLDRWLAASEPRWRGSTACAQRQIVAVRLVPHLGARRLGSLTRLDVQACVAALQRGGLAPATVRQSYATLKAALAQAVAWELLPRSPAQGIALPALPEGDRPAWTAAEARAFLAAVADHPRAALWRLAIDAGLRPGELYALRWVDVDLAAGAVAVRGTLTRDANGRAVLAGVPKTRHSRRTVPIVPATVAALRGEADGQAFRRRSAARWHDHGLVFDRGDGRPLDPSTTAKTLRAAAAAAGVPPLSPHGLRHTCASILLEADEHPKAVQERLGHGSIAITLDLYSHSTPQLQRGATDAMARLLAPDPDARATR